MASMLEICAGILAKQITTIRHASLRESPLRCKFRAFRAFRSSPPLSISISRRGAEFAEQLLPMASMVEICAGILAKQITTIRHASLRESLFPRCKFRAFRAFRSSPAL